VKDYGLLLKSARDNKGLTQEQAAEKVGVSPDSWYAYEANKRLPAKDTVNKICRVLDADWLAIYFLEAHAAGMQILPELHARELPAAVLTLVNRVLEFADQCMDRQLMQIAEDGLIDESERPVYDRITEAIDGIIDAAMAVKFPVGIKKDRPDAGTSERLVQRPKSKNDRKNYFSTSAEERQHLSRMGGATV
jgi:DNA-binding XRE family transcriptional regulator